MAAPLKDDYGPQIPEQLADLVIGASPDFDRAGFLAAVQPGYLEQPLLGRARLMALELAPRLPPDPPQAVELLVAALPPVEECASWTGMRPFLLLPFGMVVAEIGLDCLPQSMVALQEITERFTSEFSIRPFIEHRYRPTMQQLQDWTAHPSEHVRRLVSEGTRPRLPWAPALQRFIDDPAPVLDLLERLRDDPSDYVRRSVGNNLNDISKDHPALVIATAERWWAHAPAPRRAVVTRGLRTLIKQGDPEALRVIGVVADSRLSASLRIVGGPARIGGTVTLEVQVRNDAPTAVLALADLVVHFVKADGSLRPKVFKGSVREIPGNSAARFTRSVSLAQHTTRTHYPGMHSAAVLLNGTTVAEQAFEVQP